MFSGEYAHSIDEKGRLTIPAKFRAELAMGGMITRGFDQNLLVYPQEYWNAITDVASHLSLTKPEDRLLSRVIYAGATECQPDGQGRVIVPQYLRDYAGIGTEVVVVGIGKYIEVWSAEAWRGQLTIINDPVANAERFASLDLALRR